MLYLKLGDDTIMQTSVSDDQKTAVAYYRKADEFAAASGMPDQEAHTGYKLALSLMHIGSYTEAIEKFKKYRDKCYEIRDYEGKIQHWISKFSWFFSFSRILDRAFHSLIIFNFRNRFWFFFFSDWKID